jgi:hypothetical protein
MGNVGLLGLGVAGGSRDGGAVAVLVWEGFDLNPAIWEAITATGWRW